MSWSFLIAFGISVGVYLVIVGIFAIIKVYKKKKAIKSDDKQENKD